MSGGEERVAFSTIAARLMGGRARCRAEEGMPSTGLCRDPVLSVAVSRCLALPGLLPYQLHRCDKALASNIEKDWMRQHTHKCHAIFQRERELV